MTEPAQISVEHLGKNFQTPKKKERKGLVSRVGELFWREWQEIEVLKDINFEIHKGEFVGYIGANGAGKSTTIKLLTGILAPTEGRVCCAGFDPYKNRYRYTYHIGVVLGQKSILEYYVPVKASFELYREIYEMDRQSFDRRLDFFKEILRLDDYWDVPVRKLSFGERMRCEVAASLLHKPEIVFLDEPTIGLDAIAKQEIRNFLNTVNQEDKTTIILTTHDMKDIESLCRRVLMIDKGQLIYDGGVSRLRQRFLQEKKLNFTLSDIKNPELFERLRSSSIEAKTKSNTEDWRIATQGLDLSAFMGELFEAAQVEDFNLGEPELEEIVRHIYMEQGRRL